MESQVCDGRPTSWGENPFIKKCGQGWESSLGFGSGFGYDLAFALGISSDLVRFVVSQNAPGCPFLFGFMYSVAR